MAIPLEFPAVIDVRPATRTDRNTALAILLNAARRQAAHGFRAWPSDDLARAVDEALGRGELYLAFRAGTPVGAFMLQWADPAIWGGRPDDAGYIHKLAVLDLAAGMGVGRAIVRWAEERARSAGRAYLRLDCDAGNPRLNRYYHDAGFHFRGVHELAGGFPLSLYEMPLEPPAHSLPHAPSPDVP